MRLLAGVLFVLWALTAYGWYTQRHHEQTWCVCYEEPEAK